MLKWELSAVPYFFEDLENGIVLGTNWRDDTAFEVLFLTYILFWNVEAASEGKSFSRAVCARQDVD